MTGYLRKILMCIVLLAFALLWFKIRIIFGRDGEGVALRIVFGVMYWVLAVFVTWILCRTKESAENFNNAITCFFRRPDVAFAMCVLSVLVPLGYLLVAYFRFRRWYP